MPSRVIMKQQEQQNKEDQRTEDLAAVLEKANTSTGSETTPGNKEKDVKKHALISEGEENVLETENDGFDGENTSSSLQVCTVNCWLQVRMYLKCQIFQLKQDVWSGPTPTCGNPHNRPVLTVSTC